MLVSTPASAWLLPYRIMNQSFRTAYLPLACRVQEAGPTHQVEGSEWPKAQLLLLSSGVRGADSVWSSAQRTCSPCHPLSIQRDTTRPTLWPGRSAAGAICAECIARTSRFLEQNDMQADAKGVLTGVHFLDGDHACCEGTLAAGARFSAGYPITPSTEVVERFAQRIPMVGGVFIQMEDELAASIAIQGAVGAARRRSR